jgi:predicted metal-dependent peptidase
MNAMQRMTKARAMMVMDQPFFATLALYLKLVETTTKVEALGTDGVSLFFNPKWVEDKTDLQLQFGWAHEVEHLARRHHTRRCGRDFKKWNVATDYGINGDLVRAGFVPPACILIDNQYDGLSAEQIYRMREDELAEAQKAQERLDQAHYGDESDDDQSGGGDDADDDDAETDDAEGDGDGEPDDAPGEDHEGEDADPGEGDDSDADEGTGDDGGESDDGDTGENEGAGDDGGETEGGKSDHNLTPDEEAAVESEYNQTDNASSGQGEGDGDPIPSFGNCGAVMDAAESPADMAAVEAEWEARVRQAINVAVKQAGNVPGYLQRIIDELNASRVDWKDVLRRFIDSRSRTDSTWSRPNRRMLHSGIVLPSMIVDGINHLGVVVDTSGSISDAILAAFAAELQAAIDEGACDRVTVVYCDAQVQGVQNFERGDEIKLTPEGGGGTDFAPALAWFVENEPDVSALIYFTDLYGNFGEEPEVPVLWAAFGDPRTIARMNVPFGELVHIEV